MNDIFEKVKSLNLEKGTYTVVGSGSMSAHGIRQHGDIDLLVTNEVFENLKMRGWKEVETIPDFKILLKDDFEVATSMNNIGGYNPNPLDLIDRSVIINEVSFASLEDTIEFKSAMGREKDLKDIELIKEYLDK